MTNYKSPFTRITYWESLVPMYMYMSLILSDNLAPPNTAHTAKTSQKVATAESSFPTSSVIPASGAFNEAVFHGGTLILQ